LKPLPEADRAVYDEIQRERKPGMFAFAYDNLFQKNLAAGLANEWQCRAGSRYLYVCEDGLVHYCSQQRGYPAIPMEQYGKEEIDREYWTKKACAPFCTVSCVHRVAMIDLMREEPRRALTEFYPAGMPAPVRMLSDLFLPVENGKPQGMAAKWMAGAVKRVLGIR
jgi:hypothetical protein